MRRMVFAAFWTGTLLSAPADEFFEKKIRPVLVERCYGCHSSKLREPKANLRLDSRDATRAGGDSGPALVPGKPEDSRLLRAISYTDLHLRMPPTGKLPNEVIADFREWIALGAPDPREEQSTSVRKPGGIDIERGRKFWAFQPVTSPAPPAVKNTAWPRNDIDRFLLAGLERKNLAPAPEADRRVWLRRVTFDLTGLPPTLNEVRRFVADQSPDAYTAVVDRLLASPQYGERWGRHWLDLVRFAETNGHEYDNNKLDAWRYRDYVIRAFNEDLPYNAFVREHIAGDLLPEKRVSRDGTILESPIATNFYFFGEVLNSATDSEKTRADTVDNQIDVLSKTFLGLTVACARCHDHKFDPIPTKDYYGLAGILHSTTVREEVVDSPDRAAIIRNAHTELGTSSVLKSYRRSPGKSHIVLRPGDEIFEDFSLEGWGDWYATGEAFAEGPRGGVADSAGLGSNALVGSLTSRKFRMPKRYVHVLMSGGKGDKKLVEREPLRLTLVADDYRSAYFLASGKPGFEWVTQHMVLPFQRMCYFELVDRSRAGNIAVDAIVLSDHKTPPEIEVGEPASWGPPPATNSRFPASSFAMIARDENPRNVRLHIRGSHQNLGDEVPRHVLQVIPLRDSSQSISAGSGRMQLADWLASPENPLTARVWVNRVWKHHFGQGLVRTTDNFGLTGERPSNKDLLDFLTTRFIADGWSLKKLHRTIVLSAAYRMGSGATAEAEKIDPRNELLHHYPVRRLEAEAIRDAVLAVSQRLDRRLYGPSVTPYIAPYQQGRGKPASGPLDGDGRRSIYIEVRRNFLTPMLLAFDYPLPISTMGTRGSSTVPSQALILLNDEFVLQQASVWAARVRREAPGNTASITQMFREAFSRDPEAWELKESREFLAQGRTLAELAHVLYNSAEFLYVQ